MLRNQLIISSILVLTAVVLLVLNNQTDTEITSEITPVLLFPVRTAVSYHQFLAVSKARIDQLEIQASRLMIENFRLKENYLYSDTAGEIPPPGAFIRALIIGRDPSDFNGFLIIDKGRVNRVNGNLPVVIGGRLVGKIRYAGSNYSIVETIENKSIAISAIDAKTGVNGIVRHPAGMVLDYIKIDDDIRPGDSIYTSGMSEIFPAGILIGTVQRVATTGDLLFKQVHVAPAARVNRLFYVHVLTLPDSGSLKIPPDTSVAGAGP